MGFSLKKIKKAVSKPLRALDVTASSSAVRSGLRSVDRMVGGAKGWGTGLAVVGTVAAATGFGTAAGAALVAAGKGVAAKGVADDAARAERKARKAAERELALAVAADGGPAIPGLAAIGSPSVTVPEPGARVAPLPSSPAIPPAVPAAGAAALGFLALGPVGLVAAVPAFLLARKD